ncbi:MAG: DUF1015 domain-containing protein [Rubrivivax sp.]
MAPPIGFRLPRVCLPSPGIDMKRWAVVACDQYTAEPQVWQQLSQKVGDAPSTLHLILPEAHLGAADEPERIRSIQHTMRHYLADGLLHERDAAVLVERRLGKHTRRGLLLELDLEHYDFRADSTSLIRPTEGTMVARLAPRIAVRTGAELEVPHVLVLIDDPQRTVIEALAADAPALEKLYDTDLMLGGGHVTGYAVDATRAARAVQALQALAEPEAFAARYGVPSGTPPMLFAVGDGNHSLATAKSMWDSVKATLSAQHRSRYALVEVVNIHDPAVEFAAIHRLLFGVGVDVRQALADFFGSRVNCIEVASADAMRQRVQAAPETLHAAGLIGPGERFCVVEITEPASSLPVATFQTFIDRLIEQGGAAKVDYVHGDAVLERLSVQQDRAGFHLAAVGKSQLLRRVVREGPMPRKAFSMGEAHEKRFYVESRRIRESADLPPP